MFERKRGLPCKCAHVLCYPIKTSVLFHLWCVWILFQNVTALSAFQSAWYRDLLESASGSIDSTSVFSPLGFLSGIVFRGSHPVARTCSYGHILQRCPLPQTARTNVWPTAVQLHTELYGSKEELEKTATFILQTGLSVQQRSRRRRRRTLAVSSVSNLFCYRSTDNQSKAHSLL